jgi:hypothetical protein
MFSQRFNDELDEEAYQCLWAFFKRIHYATITREGQLGGIHDPSIDDIPFSQGNGSKRLKTV